MENKIKDLLKDYGTWQVDNFGENGMWITEESIIEVSQEIVKLFSVPSIIKSVCTCTETDDTYLGDNDVEICRYCHKPVK